MTDNKLTDEQIIEALKRCSQHYECCYCNSVEECGNKRVLTTSALDLINRQKAEIERLEKILDKRCDVCTAVTYARKEFAERLKEMATSTFYEERKYVDTEDIDNLLEEMDGESE